MELQAMIEQVVSQVDKKEEFIESQEKVIA